MGKLVSVTEDVCGEDKRLQMWGLKIFNMLQNNSNYQKPGSTPLITLVLPNRGTQRYPERPALTFMVHQEGPATPIGSRDSSLPRFGLGFGK